MDLQTIVAIVAVCGAISTILVSWIGRSKAAKQETAAEAGKDASMRSDIDYIKRGVDDMRLEQRAQGQRFDILAERVTRVEESAKQAHHRLNRIEGAKGE